MPLAGDTIRALDFPAEVEDDQTGSEVTGISSTSYEAGSTECAVTFAAGTSGKARIHVYGRISSDGTNRIWLTFEIREGSDASGALFQVADDNHAVSTKVNGVEEGQDAAKTISGLTAGATYFVRTMHRVAGGSSGRARRRLAVEPVH